MPRLMRPGARSVSALCKQCGWWADKANAQAIASQHADQHPGHVVLVDIHQVVVYTGIRHKPAEYTNTEASHVHRS